jgi:hypothetical protein
MMMLLLLLRRNMGVGVRPPGDPTVAGKDRHSTRGRQRGTERKGRLFLRTLQDISTILPYVHSKIATRLRDGYQPYLEEGVQQDSDEKSFNVFWKFFYNVFRATRYRTTSLPASLNQARRIDTLL